MERVTELAFVLRMAGEVFGEGEERNVRLESRLNESGPCDFMRCTSPAALLRRAATSPRTRGD